MMTAMLCVANIVAGRQVFDLWRVNQDAEYHEAGSAGAQNRAAGLRLVPIRVAPDENRTGVRSASKGEPRQPAESAPV